MRLFPLFVALFVIFALQFLGAMYQVRQYRKAVRRVHKLGNVGIGQKKGGFSMGHLVLVVCDENGIIRETEVMEGMTFLTRFKPREKLLGRTFSGSHIEEFLSDFRQMPPKKRKKYRGYIQAMEALDMRLYPEHEGVDRMVG